MARLFTLIVGCALVVATACQGEISSSNPNSGSGGASGGDASGGRAVSGGSGGVSGGTGGVSGGTGGVSGGTGGSGGGIPIAANDLCAGLVQDKQPRPMGALAKPALGAVATDAEFNVRIRRISAVGATGGNPAIRPLYTTVSSWNADESRLLLYNVAMGRHELYDGKTYQLIRSLAEIKAADIEQLYWSTSDPDVLFYVEGKNFIRYHVGDARKESVTTFTFCSGNATGGDDPMFTSFDSKRIGLRCGDQVFIYDITSNSVIARKTMNENPAQVTPSGTLAYLSSGTARVTDAMLNVVRTLDLAQPDSHAAMSRLPTGEDTWNGSVFDPGPRGNADIGMLVTWDLSKGTSRVIIGPKTGWPYPPDGHLSGMAYRQPGWVFVSTFGNTSGKGLLDLEMLIADTSTGIVCRAGRHRSWGKANTHLAEPYWAEAHTVPSPSGTRAVFASDWGNGATVDAYILELPVYKP